MNEYDPAACRNLIASIFHRAIRDLERGKTKRQDALEFLNGSYAEKLADYLDIDIRMIREKVNESK